MNDIIYTYDNNLNYINFYFQKMKLTITNSLILISTIFTAYGYYNSDIFMYWISSLYISRGDYVTLFYQLLVHNFIHSWFIHLFFNSIFLFVFWNKIEILIWKNKYLLFFILTLIFNSIFLIILNPTTSTVWISWFAMAILSFYTLKLKEIWDEDYKWWITWLVINILIWFSDKISLVWHLFWWIFWIIYFYTLKLFNKYD